MDNRIKISKTTVAALPHPTSGQVIYRDSKMSGFCVRVGVNTKTYLLQKKLNGKQLKVKLGVDGDITAATARKMAEEAKGEIAKGINPTDRKRASRAKGITLWQCFQDFLSARKSLKPRTVKDMQYSMDAYFSDWKNTPLSNITRDMVKVKHKKIGEGKGGKAQANLAMRYLRSVFNFASGEYTNTRGKPVIKDNPVTVLSLTRAWYRVDRKRTLINNHDLPLLFDALESVSESTSSKLAGTIADYIRFLLLTGMRRQEAATLRWDQVNLKEKTLTITDTKNRRPLILPLSDYLHDLLVDRHSTTKGEYVFPNLKGEPLKDPKRQMNNIRNASGLSFSIHDIRRTFITIADSLDISSYAIKLLVNHSTGSDVTAGYIISDVERLRKPMQQITDRILTLAGRKQQGKVVSIRSELAV